MLERQTNSTRALSTSPRGRGPRFGGTRFRGTRFRGDGFTLIEILVVIGIILIIALLALPAFNVLTGSRSIEAASNLVSSALAAARAEALNRQQVVGLAVYFDQEQQRTALATVGFPQLWQAGVSYQRGDVVYRNEAGTQTFWICHRAHTSSDDATLAPSDLAPSTTATQPGFANGASGSWARFDPSLYSAALERPTLSADRYVSILPETGVIYLPPGIGAQVLTSSRVVQTSGRRAITDHYLRAGVVFFDADGRLVPTQSWGVLFQPEDLPAPLGPAQASSSIAGSTGKPMQSSRLGLAIRFNYRDGVYNSYTKIEPRVSYNLDPLTTTTFPNSAPLSGGLGVVLYDRAAYEANQATVFSSQNALLRPIDFQTSDSLYLLPGFDKDNPNTWSTEQQIESWLDNNATLLLINRFTGTLLRTE